MTSGEVSGTKIPPLATFLYALASIGAIAAVICTLNVITSLHDTPALNPIEPIVWEASSWLTLVLFFWLPWLGYRLAPPCVQPRWHLLLHLPVMLAFAIGHIGGFVLLRKAVYLSWGGQYVFGPFWHNIFYECSKDALGYALIFAIFAFVEKARQRPETPALPLTFDIRDGATLNRVMLDDILAVSSAGN